MKCIDAIEGMVKIILTRICASSVENTVDMSEYVRSVKSVLDATREYVETNPEITTSPEMLTSVLYNHARDCWLGMAVHSTNQDASTALDEETKEYLEYCFDYLYSNGTYPL
jgi:hypothetical protein